MIRTFKIPSSLAPSVVAGVTDLAPGARHACVPVTILWTHLIDNADFVPLREGEGRLSFVKGPTSSRNNSSPQSHSGKGTISAVNQLLIIDDDRALVNLLKRFLEAEGFHVDAAYDHDSGLAAARSRQHELVILDVMLPGGSGFELLKALRHDSAVPVLLLTARGEAVDRILGLKNQRR